MTLRGASILAILILISAQGWALMASARGETDDGYPREIEDSLGRKVVLDEPVERIIALGNYRAEAVKVLGAEDLLVGIDGDSLENNHYFPELADLPPVGTWMDPDIEAIADLDPDIVITSANTGRISKLEEALSPFGIVVVGLDFYRDNLIQSEVTKLGYLLDKEEEAEEYITWREGNEKIIEDYVSSLEEDEKPTVYLEWGSEPGKSYGNGSSGQFVCDFTGAINIAQDLDEYPTLDMEWIIARNPDFIVKTVNLGSNWGWDSTEEAQKIIDDLKNRPGWDNISAVKNDHMYVIGSEIAWGLDSIVFEAYCAKWYHSDIDLDPVEIYRNYLDSFLGIEYPEGLIVAYPEP